MEQVREQRSPALIDGARQAIETVGPGIRRQMLGYGPQIMLCRVWFDQGSVGEVHSHPHSQSSYVESGRFLVSVGGVERSLCAGDSFYAEPHVKHGSVCIEAGSMIDAFSPLRADFLGGENS